MLYELRIYHVHEGRMDALLRRFSQTTLKLFKRYGMKIVDFWQDADGARRVYYLLEHQDKEARDRGFSSFAADPEWIAAKNSSEEHGPIVVKVENYFMQRVPFSPAGREPSAV